MEHLVLLPGTLCDQRLWQEQCAQLDGVATLQVGNIATQTTVASSAQAILQTAPARFALAGHSLGGIVALEIFRQAPNRVERLALFNTSARALTAEQGAEWNALGRQAASGGFDSIAETFLPPMLAAARRNEQSLVAALQEMARAVGAEAFLHQVSMQLSRRDNRALLATIRCPTLVVAGREDQVCPLERQNELIEALPNATLVVVEQCGHLSPIEQPVAVANLLRDWLQTSASHKDAKIAKE